MPTWDRAFDRSTVAYVNAIAPRVYAEINRHANTSATFPDRIHAMSRADIREGELTGAGHGLYYPDDQRIELNPDQPKWQMLANFVHENCHHACPELAEHEIRELSMDVVEAVQMKRPRRNPIKGVPGGSVSSCIEQMKRRGDIDDPGAYCAAIADRLEPGWRQRNPYDPKQFDRETAKIEIEKWRKMKRAAEDAMDRAPPNIQDMLADDDPQDIPPPWDRIAQLYDTATIMLNRLQKTSQKTKMLRNQLLR